MDEDLNRTKISNNQKQLSPKSAVLVEIVFILFGLAIVLLGFGVIHVDPSKFHAPHWVIVCAGLMFALGGAAVINGYAFGPGERYFTMSTSFSTENVYH